MSRRRAGGRESSGICEGDGLRVPLAGFERQRHVAKKLGRQRWCRTDMALFVRLNHGNLEQFREAMAMGDREESAMACSR
jgi:hypothetical protein